MLTKSDFLLYLESPMHLWAAKHNHLEHKEPSDFSKILMQQGYAVESLAIRFLYEILLPRYPNAELKWQETFTTGEFTCRADALIFDKNCNVYDVYEIKSSTHIDKENEYDLTFQTLIYQEKMPIRNVHIIHLNKEYVRQGEISLEQLFVIENLNEKVETLKSDVFALRETALKVVDAESCKFIEGCTKPKSCVCPDLCHSNLPQYPIYDLIGATKPKHLKLKQLGVERIEDIPEDFRLTPKQQHQLQSVINHTPYVDYSSIKCELDKLTYPLYFLDYETFGSAIPMFDGYKPQQPLVFQYSLHKVEANGSINHFEHISITKDDPALTLLDQLQAEIGPVGSVLVWNKTFETGRNKEMAERYPQYADFLNGVNERICDLADCFKNGYLIHPDFHGSWSIKNVLPVLVPNLSYKGMNIAKGDQAMATWWILVQALTKDEEKEPKWLTESDDRQKVTDMLKYCELDTFAMVEIWRYLNNLRLQSVTEYQQPIVNLNV